MQQKKNSVSSNKYNNKKSKGGFFRSNIIIIAVIMSAIVFASSIGIGYGVGKNMHQGESSGIVQGPDGVGSDNNNSSGGNGGNNSGDNNNANNNLTAPFVGKTENGIAWYSVPNATSYVVEVSGNQKTFEKNTATFEEAGITLGRTNEVRVKAIVGNEETNWGNNLIFTPYNDSSLEMDSSPDAAAKRFEKYMPRDTYEKLFPNRFGSQNWRDLLEGNGQFNLSLGEEADKKYDYDGDGIVTYREYWRDASDYYSYDNWIAAIKRISNYALEVRWRENASYTAETTVINKVTGNRTIIIKGDGIDESWNLDKPIITVTNDFGAFLMGKDENDRKRELAGFLGNTSHETTGGWPDAPGGTYAYGLFYNEEVGEEGSMDQRYSSESPDWPAVPGKAYHGRGPIQLSYNYNYGLVSNILFEDKNVLLNNPEFVTEGGVVNGEHLDAGVLGCETGLLFWLMAQSPKASCSDVMSGRFVPNEKECVSGFIPSFGLTIVVINGGVEAGLTEDGDNRIKDRAGFYKTIAKLIGADIEGEKVDTKHMMAWA